jgi:hypothetical protein
MQLYPEIQDIATIDKNFILAVISFYVAYNCIISVIFIFQL